MGTLGVNMRNALDNCNVTPQASGDGTVAKGLTVLPRSFEEEVVILHSSFREELERALEVAATVESNLQAERRQLELRNAEIETLTGELQRRSAQLAALEANFQAERRRVLFYADRLSEVSRLVSQRESEIERLRSEHHAEIEWVRRQVQTTIEAVSFGLSQEELRARLVQAAKHQIPLLRMKRLFTYPSRKARRRYRAKLKWWKIVRKAMET
jgi:hypothetical protein